jgi:hypothetical protein
MLRVGSIVLRVDLHRQAEFWAEALNADPEGNRFCIVDAGQ